MIIFRSVLLRIRNVSDKSRIENQNIHFMFVVAQSVQRLTTDWTVRDRIPVVMIFSASPDRTWGPPSLLQNGYRVFPGGKVRPGRAADHLPPSSAAVMEEQSYTSSHPLGHTGPVTRSLYLYIICSRNFFPENCAVYELIWKNMVQPDRPQMKTILCIRIACWITKATNTLSEYVTLINFPWQQLCYR